MLFMLKKVYIKWIYPRRNKSKLKNNKMSGKWNKMLNLFLILMILEKDKKNLKPRLLKKILNLQVWKDN